MVFGIISLGLTNILLSSDNVLAIALFSENLSRKQRIPVLFWAMIVSLTAELGILFAMSFLLRINFMQSIFGLIISFMAFKLLYKDKQNKPKEFNNRQAFSPIWIVAAGNLMMSFENEVTLISLTRGNVLTAWYGIAATSPLIFFASDMIVWVLRRYDFVFYIGSIILLKIGLDMIFTLPGLVPFSRFGPWVLTVLYGIHAAVRYLHIHDRHGSRLR